MKKKKLNIENVKEIATESDIFQAKEFAEENVMFALNGQLDEFRNIIEQAGFKIRCSWTDEYGGVQSITLNNIDNLEIIKEAK